MKRTSGTASHSDSAHRMRVGWMEWALRVAMMAALGGVDHRYIKFPGCDDVPAGLSAVTSAPGTYGFVALFVLSGDMELAICSRMRRRRQATSVTQSALARTPKTAQRGTLKPPLRSILRCCPRPSATMRLFLFWSLCCDICSWNIRLRGTLRPLWRHGSGHLQPVAKKEAGGQFIAGKAAVNTDVAACIAGSVTGELHSSSYQTAMMCQLVSLL
jgi:hypothetical protein